MLGALGLLACLALAQAEAAAGVDISRGPLTAISGEDPYSDLCGVQTDATPGTASSPAVAVDPADPKHLVAAWHQNWYLTVMTAASFDGGKTWKRAEVPGIHRCTGGADDVAVFPHVAFGPDGRAYLSLTAGSGGFPPADSDLLVSRSRKGGRAWSDPVAVTSGSITNGASPAIAADPHDPDRLVAVWHSEPPPLTLGSRIESASSHDGGRSWSEPRVIYRPPRPRVPFGHSLVALRDGSLIYPFVAWEIEYYAPLTALGTTALNMRFTTNWDVQVIRSSDGGRTWSDPKTLGPTGSPLPQAPDTGEVANIETFPSITSDGRRRVLVAWHSIDGPRESRILSALSRDGGQSYGPPRTVRSVSSHAFQPTVAMTRDGSIGMTYYDLLDDKPEDGQLTATIRMLASDNAGRSWDGSRFARSFDLHATVPYVYGQADLLTFQNGQRQALVRSGRGLLSATTVGPPLGTGPLGSVVASRLRIGHR
jgi:hypothetical protein